MAFVSIDSSAVKLTLKHVETKRDRSFQYRRRIPKDLQPRYLGRKFFVRSLGRDINALQNKAISLTNQLDTDWCTLRGQDTHIETLIAKNLANPFLNIDRQKYSVPSVSLDTRSISLTDSLSLYLKYHPKGKQEKFRRGNERVIQALISRIGNLDLSAISRSHAEDYRDNALRSQSTATVRRSLHSLTAIINKVRKEKQIQVVNPFSSLGIAGEGSDGRKRIPFDGEELTTISSACRDLDDDIRYIVAIQMDTGCRVAEVVGLRMEDVVLDSPYPHVKIRPFGKVRTLKTAASERDIPLVGETRWAAERAIVARSKAADDCPWLFPRYASDKEIKATHASNTLNKWLRSIEGVSRDKTTHCFRHAMRDRLRAAQVPHDIQEAIGGWGTRTIGQGYGNGYPLQVLAEHMRKIVLP